MKIIKSTLCLILMLAMTSAVCASLTNTYQFNGKGNWSIDAIGSNNNPVGTVQAMVPLGSTVEKAFLYSSKTPNRFATPNVTLAGTTYTSWTALGVTAGLQAYRTDVTAQMVAAIGGGSASLFNFTVVENSDNSSTDGEVLVIVYSNPADVERTIGIKDGFSATTGDSTAINFASTGLTGVGNPGFEALMSLGIGYGFQGSGQVSLVDGNGRRLTSSAGGQDDGGGFNGGLITAGGIGDSPLNPNDPNAGPAGNPRFDDELYDLGQGNVVDPTPFLSNGLTSYTIATRNPSNNDNIFFLGFNITAKAGIDKPPPPDNGGPVPEPSSFVIFALLGAIGLLVRRRRR